MNNFKDILDNIKGFLDEEEGQALYETAKQASLSGPCLEIGSYCGKSAVYLGTACRENNEILFSIDHHRGSEEQQSGEEYFDPDLFDASTGMVNTFEKFRKTLSTAGLENTVVPLVCRSHVAARSWATPLSLVFIDGGHTFEAAETDYKCWSDHIIAGGFLLIHDIFPDPSQGGQAPYQIYRKALASEVFIEVRMVRTLGILRKKTLILV
ncbi:MAG: class I SAM-dependent methyltransferase [Desulfobacterales bacterium]|nr:class I SAM-dependent methyltransferase [Desulfobacterales bacterium]